MDVMEQLDKYGLYILSAGAGLAIFSGFGLFGLSEMAWTGWAIGGLGFLAGLTRISADEYGIYLTTMTAAAVLSIANNVTDLLGGWIGTLVNSLWPVALAAAVPVIGKAIWKVFK